MRTVTLYRHGMTMGTPPSRPPKDPPKRGDVNGWSKSATRRNTTFLMSVNEDSLACTEDGELLASFAFTLTLRDCPKTFQDWHKLRRAFMMRIQRMGLYRSHWVTEWQRRGVPHLHGAFWFPTDNTPETNHQTANKIIEHWLKAAADYSPTYSGQHFNLIYDDVGWFKYLSKHASRGVSHYQRNKANIPAGWQKTGRVWGYTGTWDLIDPDKRLLPDSDWFTARRLARNWRLADARTSGNRHRIKQARTMLKHNHPELSKLRGVKEWIPNETMSLIVAVAISIGDLKHEQRSRVQKG